MQLKTNLVYPLIITLTIVLLYHNVVYNGFSGLDDILMIEENWDHLTQWSHIYTAFTEDVFNGTLGSYYRPIQILSYMPDAILSKADTPSPFLFFYGNILLFIVAILSLFFFLKEFDFSANYRLIFTLLFAIHPTLTPAVAWIPGRVDTLLFILVIGAIWSFIKFIKTDNKYWMASHLVFFAFAMFTKETAIVIPMITMLLMLYLSNTWTNSTNWTGGDFFNLRLWKNSVTHLTHWIKSNYILLTGWLATLLFWYVLRKNALPDNPLDVMSALAQISTSWQEVFILFGTIFLPFNLQVFLEITWPFILLAIPGFILFLILPSKIFTPKKDFLFGVLWIFIFIFPTTLSDYLNYHRMFLPLIGMAFIMRPLDLSKRPKFNTVFIGLLAVLFVVENLGFQKAFVNRTNFWTNAVTYSPSSAFANNGLAWSFHLSQQNDSALKYYQRVVDIRPDRENVRIGMALLHEQLGQYHKADSLLQAEFIVTKDSASVYFYRGQLWLERGDSINAFKQLKLGYPFTERSRNARLFYDSINLVLPKPIR